MGKRCSFGAICGLGPTTSLTRQSTHAQYDGRDMLALVEVYDLRQDKEEQLNERRIMRLPRPVAPRFKRLETPG